jgi:hypothetical protein
MPRLCYQHSRGLFHALYCIYIIRLCKGDIGLVARNFVNTILAWQTKLAGPAATLPGSRARLCRFALRIPSGSITRRPQNAAGCPYRSGFGNAWTEPLNGKPKRLEAAREGIEPHGLPCPNAGYKAAAVPHDGPLANSDERQAIYRTKRASPCCC